MAHATLDLEPLHATFGARVRGIRLASLDEASFDSLYEAWLEYALLVFDDQFLTRAEQVTLAHRFGELKFDIAPLSNVRSDGSVRADDDSDDVIKVLKGSLFRIDLAGGTKTFNSLNSYGVVRGVSFH